jgi:hypothetical protein
MTDRLKLLFVLLPSLFESRAQLEAENLVLRQRLNVLRRRIPNRLAPTNLDRLVFVWLYCLFLATVDIGGQTPRALPNMIEDAWVDSANTPVGYPMVNVRDIRNGKVRPTRELFGAD